MLRKISLVLSVLAALGFAVSISTPADAAAGTGKNVKSMKVNSNKGTKSTKTMKTNKTVIKTNKTMKVMKTNKFVVGKTYNGHVYYGHKRHRWHNKWYGYGEGECWIRVDGEWFWNILVCPN
jgi:Ni/Co efflux regulator RcnB